MLPLIAVIGVSVGALLTLLYLSFSAATPKPEPRSNSTVSKQQFAPLVPPITHASVNPEPSPSIAPSPSPSIEASASPQPSASIVELSSNPITTTPGAPSVRGQMIIHLANGAQIEADEVWQTGEGIWYRKGTMMSLLDPRNVKSIDKVNSSSAAAAAKPSLP